MNGIISFCLAALVVIPAHPLPTIDDGKCHCEENRVQGGWCLVCRAGYLAGVRVSSSLLYEIIDTHGHDIDLEALKCEACRKAVETDGYCPECRIGFLRKKAHIGRLGYELARGETVASKDLNCTTCRKNSDRFGWCERCGAGMIGNVRLRSKEGYEAAAAEFERFLNAVELFPQCKTCAFACYSEGYCHACKKSFGQKKPTESPREPSK